MVVRMGEMESGSRGTWRTRVLVGVTSLLLLVHAVLQGVGAAAFWQPCVDDGFLSDACAYLQYEVPTPWWAYLSWLWLVEIALLILALVGANRSARRIWPAVSALGLVVLCNTVTDYVITPAFNGGYTSADSPPGFGIFSAVAVGIAGCLLPLMLLPRVKAAQLQPAI